MKLRLTLTFGALCISLWLSAARNNHGGFRVLAFYTAKNDQAHISFVQEADRWFGQIARKNHFQYTATNQWSWLNADTLKRYQLVIFLDTRPDDKAQREAFEKYMKNGGAFIGFHFSAFALTPSTYPQNWDWYHNEFLGSGEYLSNTWKPTSAVLKVEDRSHPVMKHLPRRFRAQPNEWYRWKNDLTQNPDIKILASVDPSSFPLGTGPKPYEIWHEGYYPVVWTNTKYRMVYINMGHNDIDYEHDSNKELSFSFINKGQNRMILNALRWLAERR